ncbi:MAG TPA: SDR family oxidoreductase [Paludibacteraceae bacterium]|jgi:NAD(P)-dependent dehydrogenase (short-subunit alcohol dehydrogenase family)|nr:SDR family oxidoreductase [Paludibacteraceae bacterium]HQB68931.1 SDR family oxidoreductase [Paludibacteraceae bacterium]HRS67241.1 SDR family oxidoreductase [Paludibacteraceae bacterium]
MKQKIILITGASSGFGKKTATYLAAHGHIVYGTSRKDDTLEHVTMLVMDVTNRQSVTTAVEQVIAKHGRIDVLINNAGVGIAGAVELATPEEIALQMDTNFGGVVNVCSVVLPFMRAKRCGLIINLSSIGGVFGIPYQGFYSASKFAIEGYSEALSLEVAQFGIKVVLVEPGDFSTGFTGSRVISQKTMMDTDYKESFARVLKNIEHDEQNGGDPIYLAKKIGKIVVARRPKLRYVVAPDILQQASVVLSKLMCGRHFQWLLRKFYSV